MSEKLSDSSSSSLEGLAVITALPSVKDFSVGLYSTSDYSTAYFIARHHKLLLLLAGLISLFSLFFWIFNGGVINLAYEHSLIFILGMAGIVLSISGGVLWLRISKEDNLIKVATLNDRGITLSRLGRPLYTVMDGYVLDWSNIKSIHPCQASLYGIEGEAICIEMKDRRAFVLSVENAFAWLEPYELLENTRRYAPDVYIELPKKPEIGSDDPRYTKIWLDSISTQSSRARRGPLKAGDKLMDGAIEILEKLASGGQGIIYLARVDVLESFSGITELNEKSLVVLKEFVFSVREGLESDRSDIRSFERESAFLSSLSHPDIVKVYDAFIEDRRGYIMLEYLEGESLRRFVEREGVVSMEIARKWCMKVCNILDYLHNLEAPLLHLDISPDNILICRDENLKLIDFTIAQRAGTTLSTMSGKIAYMPPEQVKGKPLACSDIYALGATLYFLLTGKDPEPLTELRIEQEGSSGINKILEAATRQSASERIQSASELHDMLSSSSC